MTRVRVAWSGAARADLTAIVQYIALERERVAIEVLDRLECKARSLDAFPDRGRIVPELRWQGVMSFKEIIDSPWRIVYYLDADGLIIVGIFDSRRDLTDILIERITMLDLNRRRSRE